MYICPTTQNWVLSVNSNVPDKYHGPIAKLEDANQIQDQDKTNTGFSSPMGACSLD